MSFRLATFNICSSHFAEGKYTRRNLEMLGSSLRASGSDVVSLQEVDCGCERSDRVDMTRELATLGGYAYSYFIKIRNFQGGEYGTAILSSYKFADVGTLNYEVKTAKQGTSCGYVTLLTPDSNITLFNTHLSVESEEANTETLLCLRKILMSHGGEYLCTGDFNTSPGKIHKYIPELNMANSCLYTYADRSIDNILYTNGFTLTGTHIMDTQYDGTTDHNMLISTVSSIK